MKRKLAPGILAVLLLAILFTLLSCTQQSADIMAGSSLITDIIQDVADGTTILTLLSKLSTFQICQWCLKSKPKPQIKLHKLWVR